MPDDYRDALYFSSDIGYQTAIDALYQMRTLWGTEMSGFISGHIIQILAALRISAQDLELIRQFTGLVDKSTKLPLILHTETAHSRQSLYPLPLCLSCSEPGAIGERPHLINPVDWL